MGIPLTIVTIHTIMIAMILDLAPAIFEQQANDGSRATRAAQKTPTN
jgi:hypothetical protein